MTVLLASYKSKLEDLAEKYLRSYIDLISTRQKLRDPKIFNDSIWHSILLYPFEIILLDSPLFQRLRRIRQLGLAHLVYPCAVHTRFEHTIGTVYQVGCLTDSINASLGNCLDDQNIHLLRIAALCHDIGQGVMSHVSENALENNPESELLKQEFADELELDHTKLSEIAAYYLVGSPAFYELMSTAKEVSADYTLPEKVEESVQKIIIGLHISDQIPCLNELVSGPFDADKLDYMMRDAMMSGVPVVVDISRLVLKTRAVRVPQTELPKEVAAKVKEGLTNYTFLGIDLSGGHTLDELMLARTLLFDKVYHHQKLRAAEVMVASIILQLIDLSADGSALMSYKLTDEELISLDSEKITDIVGEKTNSEDLNKVSIILDLSTRLRERRLFVRCIAFAKTMPNDAYSTTIVQIKGIEELLRVVTDSVHRIELANEIAKETESIIRTLHKEALLVGIPGGQLKPYVWISTPKPPSEGSDITRAYLIAGERHILPFKREAAETRGWADAYILTRDIGYAFAPAEFSAYVFLAAELLLRIKYGIHLPSLMMTYAKQDAEVIDDLKKALFDKGYYSKLPRDIWPMPRRLTRADVNNRIEKIVSITAGYQGPDIEYTGSTSKISNNIRPDRLKDWLRQFEKDEMVEAALTTLEKIRFVGRSEVQQLLENFFQKHGNFQTGVLCPLGLPKDSSSIVTYYAMDVANKYNMKSCVIEDALSTDKPIVFVDDFIGRGHQSVSILENWLDVKKTVELGEERGKLLSKSQRKLLRQKKLAFVFTAGWTDGEKFLQKRCHELKLDAVVYVGISEKELPDAYSINVFNRGGRPTEFQKLCTDIGKQLMSGKEFDASKADERALGYGNRANLVILPYNAPAQTLTCLWASGSYNGADWVPLFPRRKKR